MKIHAHLDRFGFGNYDSVMMMIYCDQISLYLPNSKGGFKRCHITKTNEICSTNYEWFKSPRISFNEDRIFIVA